MAFEDYRLMEIVRKATGWDISLRCNGETKFWIPWQQIGIWSSFEEVKKDLLTIELNRNDEILWSYSFKNLVDLAEIIDKNTPNQMDEIIKFNIRKNEFNKKKKKLEEVITNVSHVLNYEKILAKDGKKIVNGITYPGRIIFFDNMGILVFSETIKESITGNHNSKTKDIIKEVYLTKSKELEVYEKTVCFTKTDMHNQEFSVSRKYIDLLDLPNEEDIYISEIIKNIREIMKMEVTKAEIKLKSVSGLYSYISNVK